MFWIDCGSGKHKKKFLQVERGIERQKLRQESEQFDQGQNWSSKVVVVPFFFVHFFFCQPNSDQNSASLCSNQQSRIHEYYWKVKIRLFKRVTKKIPPPVGQTLGSSYFDETPLSLGGGDFAVSSTSGYKDVELKALFFTLPLDFQRRLIFWTN